MPLPFSLFSHAIGHNQFCDAARGKTATLNPLIGYNVRGSPPHGRAAAAAARHCHYPLIRRPHHGARAHVRARTCTRLCTMLNCALMFVLLAPPRPSLAK